MTDKLHESEQEGEKKQELDTADKSEELKTTLSLSETEELAQVTLSLLQKELGEGANLELVKRGEFFRVCINAKNQSKKSVSQIEITVTKDLKFNVHLNDYEHMEDYYFFAGKLTDNELADEVENFKSFVQGEKLSLENSKLEIESYDRDESGDVVLESYLGPVGKKKYDEWKASQTSNK